MTPEASDEEQGKEVEMVPAALNPEPEQQQERDVTAHPDSHEEVVAMAGKIKEVLSELEPLRARISQLLGPAGPHHVVTGDTRRRCLAFMETELSILAAFLRTSSPQHYLEDGEMKTWLNICTRFVSDIVLLLHEVDPTRHTLLRRAAQCFCRRNSEGYSSETIQKLYELSVYPIRYSMHLLATSSGLRLTPQLAEAEGKPGAVPLVGIDRPAKKILRWLSHQGTMDRDQLRVMSIVGPMGIGKTTLAVELRNRLRCETSGGRCYFQCNVMAQVPRGNDRNIRLLQDILSQVSQLAATARLSDLLSQAKTTEVLVCLVSECLRDKRYFIIIDDIRQASDWEAIKGAFLDANNPGSRILITTRVTSIAEACCSSDSYDGLVHKMKPLNEISDSYDGLVYKMKPLNEIESKTLLAKALGYKGLPDNIMSFCNEILKRCDGIPLFITCMADPLRKQLQQKHKREKKEDKKHQRFAIFSLEQVPQLPERFEQALSSVFYDFSDSRMSLLLLYLSMFPYGYKFDKDRLIWKSRYEGLALLSKPERFFSELVDRNVITCVASNCKHRQDEAEACQWQVNHFMHQFLASKSAEMGFIFTTATINLVAPAPAASATDGDNKTSGRMPRRLALHHTDPLLPSLLEAMDLSQTRSLAVSGAVNKLQIGLHKFVTLILLDLEGWENFENEDLLQVCRSKNFFLRYLSVRNTRVSKLPQEIKELRRLQTLDISYTQISELPLQVFELKDLERLDARGTQITHLPKQIVGLQGSLEYLLVGGEGSINSVETATTSLPHDVGHLYQSTVDLSDLGYRLEVLEVTWSFHQSTDTECCQTLLSCIQNCNYLGSLAIYCGLGCSMDFLGSLGERDAPSRLEKFKVTAGRFTSVPPWINGLECLSFMQITICKQPMDDLNILGELPNLQCLILGLDFIPVFAIVIGKEGFIKLQRFSVDCILPWLTFQTGAMPRLTHLQLKFSSGPAIEWCVPSGITNLPRISEVVLSYSKWCANSTSVKMMVKTVREQVAKHGNPIDLFVNGIEDHDVQAVVEEAENATGTSSSRTDAGPQDDAQAVDEEPTGVAQTEITEAEN